LAALLAAVSSRRREDARIAAFRRGAQRRLLCSRALLAWSARAALVRSRKALLTERCPRVRAWVLLSAALKQWAAFVRDGRDTRADEAAVDAKRAAARRWAGLRAWGMRLVVVRVQLGAQARAAKYRRNLLSLAALSALQAGHSLAQRRAEARALLWWRETRLRAAALVWCRWARRRRRMRLRVALVLRTRKDRSCRGRDRGRLFNASSAVTAAGSSTILGSARLRSALAFLAARLLPRRGRRKGSLAHNRWRLIAPALRLLVHGARRGRLWQAARQERATAHALASPSLRRRSRSAASSRRRRCAW